MQVTVERHLTPCDHQKISRKKGLTDEVDAVILFYANFDTY